MAYLLTAMLTVWTFAAFQRSTTELRAADRWTTANQAFQLAEAGADRGIRWMKTQPAPPGGIIPFDPFGGRQCMNAACQDWYQVTIAPDANNPTRFNDLYSIIVNGHNGRGSMDRQITVMLRSESFSRYSYFTDLETQPSGSPIWFTTRDHFEGPVHSNDQFHIAGNPQFDGLVSSAATSLSYLNGGPPNDNPTFNGGLRLNASRINLPISVAPLRAAAAGGGLWFEGNTTITMQNNGTMLVTNPVRSWTNVQVPAPVNGAVFVNRGNLTISGVTKGQLTLGCSNDIVVANNVTYNTDPKSDPTSRDVLGLVAEQNVVISQSAPSDVTIQAAVLALNESVTVENWWQGPPRGTLTVLGGMVQKRRGPVGTFDPNTGLQRSGYSKHYMYDTRFTDIAPPYYPTTSDYQSALWQDNGS